MDKIMDKNDWILLIIMDEINFLVHISNSTYIENYIILYYTAVCLIINH